MDPQAALTMAQNALFMLLMVAAPVLATVLVVGLVVSLFQAITQINEATLAFVPKLIAAIAVFAIAGPWMMTTMVEFIRSTILSIPNYAI
ncbi:MAG: flagellar biosynthesis protein FliQ [Hydrogenophaga sp.]|jgi:flagellar biosynthetic protein FliQ|uniref:flagellar biosynthesis protein FliQ n=1 Tax=Hydrogenophaga sp. TaxID=1904254 RepID=UPI0025C616AF|nr:flagellar biosynthesis protein FliQ [Hydrogenophaga sp.]MDM7944196.1 flagellar biosynthesis protein FliQ [Hydrogenophaga sp.]MDO8888536.1 flagellar biosynthesis protein FliQ [Hydrogenophaga sp.]MDO9134480.1 flagellar biosynthesis protein FliQ [Hydrogenophaga sp.]MDO9506557.1 flagellar biosynthesis protein FliQ [Hydrogenophaga sp.]MDP1783792.1 flagellar biosynthesis protein FliQ [Hydrogenophaga sp.]